MACAQLASEIVTLENRPPNKFDLVERLRIRLLGKKVSPTKYSFPYVGAYIVVAYFLSAEVKEVASLHRLLCKRLRAIFNI